MTGSICSTFQNRGMTMMEEPKDCTQSMQEEFQQFTDSSAWKDDDAGGWTQVLANGTKFRIVRTGSHYYQPIVTIEGLSCYGENHDSLPKAMAWAWNKYQECRKAIMENCPDAKTDISPN
jgi:hypothetical protein